MSSLAGYYYKQPIKGNPFFVQLSGQQAGVMAGPSDLPVGWESQREPRKVARGGKSPSATCNSNRVAGEPLQLLLQESGPLAVAAGICRHHPGTTIECSAMY